ncbi:MAG: Gfo/Idh/MocA family oxidoreductase [Acidobacteria bacterium]|nr:Gfo/Idh/MocA family oxidoreductase [Acidobacteriota bacterium]
MFGVLLVTGWMSHQESYALGFRADPRCRIIGVADETGVDPRRAALNRRLAEELSVPLFPDLDQALGRPDVHIASVCTEHERQGRLAIRCASAAKHVYLDKPIAGSLGEARELEQAVRRAGVRSQMFTTLNLPPAIRARRAVDSGLLGELAAIHCDLHFAKGRAGAATLGSPRKEEAAPQRFLYPDAKREMFNVAVYSLALIRWLARREIRSVRAVTANYFFAENQRRGFEDFGVLALELEGALTATITAGRTGWSSHAGPGHNLTRLFGSRGSLLIDAFEARGEIASDRQSWKLPKHNPEDPMGFWRSTDQSKRGAPEWFLSAPPVRSDQSLFLDAIEQGREPEVNVAAGLAVLEALMAAYRSAATGRVIALPLGSA